MSIRNILKDLSRIYWTHYDLMVQLEGICPDEAGKRQYRRGQLQYKTLALIYDDKLLDNQ
jgi:hypothetical protein